MALPLCLAIGVIPAEAHQLQVEPVVVIIRTQEHSLTAELKGNVQDILVAANILDSERQGDGFAPAVWRRVEEYLGQHLVIRVGSKTLHGKLTELKYQSQMGVTQSRFEMRLRYPLDTKLPKKAPLEISSTLFDYLPNAQTILSIGGIQKTLDPGASVSFDRAAVATNLHHNIWDFMVMGMEHIFTGPDHMLFILALLLVSATFWDLAKTLTGFTVAHSITLILAALSVVVLPEKLTDMLIALSIVYVGIENLVLKSHRRRFWIAGGFGLVHGFGFAGILRETGLPEQGLAWCLLSFNLGVEIAQVILCAIAFPLLLAWKSGVVHRAQYGRMPWSMVVQCASVMVAVAGAYWLIQRGIG